MSNKEQLIQKALRIEYFLVSYNSLEALFSVCIGIVIGSIALIGFGLDSIIEVLSAGILIWRLRHKGNLTEEKEKEKKALFWVGITFFLLAFYVSFESIKMLVLQERPDYSHWGMLIAILSVVIMPALGFIKLSIGDKIGSQALKADAKETLFCAYLSITLLIGLGLNALWGWWWADPVAALIMVVFILKEGWECFEHLKEMKE